MNRRESLTLLAGTALAASTGLLGRGQAFAQRFAQAQPAAPAAPSGPFTLPPLGYDFGAVEPGPGSVVAFDADGKAVLLTTDAFLPDEFVAPISDWIKEGRLSGRAAPVACARCGRRIHAFQEDVRAPIMCRDCRYGPPWKRSWKRVASTMYVLVWIFGVLPGVSIR